MGRWHKTELFIYPEGADYESRNFQFRLSTATVEVDSSNFTPLPQVHRILMLLQGKMELKHEGHHTKTLNKFDLDEFEGDWKTSSKGQCVDFNLMLRKGTKGKVSGISINKNKFHYLSLEGKLNFIYIVSGKIEIKNQIINAGTLIQFKSPSEIELSAMEPSDIVSVEIIK